MTIENSESHGNSLKTEKKQYRHNILKNVRSLVCAVRKTRVRRLAKAFFTRLFEEPTARMNKPARSGSFHR